MRIWPSGVLLFPLIRASFAYVSIHSVVQVPNWNRALNCPPQIVGASILTGALPAVNNRVGPESVQSKPPASLRSRPAWPHGNVLVKYHLFSVRILFLIFSKPFLLSRSGSCVDLNLNFHSSTFKTLIPAICLIHSIPTLQHHHLPSPRPHLCGWVQLFRWTLIDT